MTVPSQTPKVTHTANGTTKSFAFTFRVRKTSHLSVYVDSTLKTLGTHYTVTSTNLAAGGTVVFVTAPANGAKVRIYRNMPYSRTDFDYQTSGTFPAATINEDLDSLALQVQQIADAVSRSVSVGLLSEGVSTALPSPESLKFLRWNAAANALENATYNVDSLLVSAIHRAEKQTATDGQTVFILSNSYLPGTNSIQVECNGSVFVSGDDYIESGANAITLIDPAIAGQTLVFKTAAFIGSVAPTSQRYCVTDEYSGSGDFDAAVAAAYNKAAMQGGGVVYFPWRLAGYTLNSFLEVKHPKVHFVGDNADIIYKFSAASQAAGLTGGTYKASPAFLIRPTAGGNKFRGLRFTQYAGFPTTYSGSYTSAATFAAIINQRADDIDIQDCYFNISTGRAAYWRGGNYGVFGNNTLVNSSVIAHIGEVSDTLFWDATTDTSTRYSPWLLSVFNNTIRGSNTTRLAPHSIFMTGVVSPNVVDNKLYGLDIDGAGAGDAIRIYANDLGCFNQDGTARTDQEMLVRNNQIYGTVGAAINVTCDSLSGGDTTPRGVVSANTINVAGLGVYVERGIGLDVSHNKVKSTSSPLVLADSCEGFRSSSNTYECTVTGESNRTLSMRSTVALTDTWFYKDRIISPASDIYAFDSSGTASGFEGGGFSGCTFVFASTSTSSRILQMSESKGAVSLLDNVFDIRATGINGRYLASIDEAAGVVTTVHVRGNTTISANATSYYTRGIAINNSDVCYFSKNDIGNAHITSSGDVFIENNKISNATSSVQPLTVSGAARVKCHDNHIVDTLTQNVIECEFIACGVTDFHNNSIAANTASVMVRATTSGVLTVAANDCDNAGAGAPYGVTGTAKISGDLGAYFSVNGSGTQWADGNRLTASTCKPGTRFFNSTDNAYNDSNGTGWYLAGSAT